MDDKNTQMLLERCADVLAYTTILLRRVREGQTIEEFTLDNAQAVTEELFQDLMETVDGKSLPEKGINV